MSDDKHNEAQKELLRLARMAELEKDGFEPSTADFRLDDGWANSDFEVKMPPPESLPTGRDDVLRPFRRELLNAQAVREYVAALAMLKEGFYGSDMTAAISKRIFQLLEPPN